MDKKKFDDNFDRIFGTRELPVKKGGDRISSKRCLTYCGDGICDCDASTDMFETFEGTGPGDVESGD